MRSRKRKPPDCATAGEATDVYKVYTWSRSCGVGTYICMRRYQRHGLLDVADTRMAVSFDVDSVNSMLWPAVHPPSDPPTLAHYSDRRPLATLPLNRPDLLRPPRVIITGPCLILDLPIFHLAASTLLYSASPSEQLSRSCQARWILDVVPLLHARIKRPFYCSTRAQMIFQPDHHETCDRVHGAVRSIGKRWGIFATACFLVTRKEVFAARQKTLWRGKRPLPAAHR